MQMLRNFHQAGSSKGGDGPDHSDVEAALKKTITQADALIVGGALAVSFFSFVGFSEFSSAWSTDWLAFATTIPAILALVTVGWYACEAAGVNLPETDAGGRFENR